MSELQGESGLGSLSQAVRSKQLNSARSILYFVGIITILANAVFYFMSESMVDSSIEAELQDLRMQNMEIDEAKLKVFRDQAVLETKLVNGSGLVIGIVFVVLGLNVKKYPVPITITGLVLYIGCWAVFGLMDPTTMFRGWIIKAFIIAGLFKAIQASIAYEKEQKETNQDQPLVPDV